MKTLFAFLLHRHWPQIIISEVPHISVEITAVMLTVLGITAFVLAMHFQFKKKCHLTMKSLCTISTHLHSFKKG
jgi:hypothetical protein